MYIHHTRILSTPGATGGYKVDLFGDLEQVDLKVVELRTESGEVLIQLDAYKCNGGDYEYTTDEFIIPDQRFYTVIMMQILTFRITFLVIYF